MKDLIKSLLAETKAIPASLKESFNALSKTKKVLIVSLAILDVIAVIAIAVYLGVLAPDNSVPAAADTMHAQAVFMVKPYSPERQFAQSGGTGFLVKPDSGMPVILTNRHVCRMDTAQPYVILEQGLAVYAARILLISTVTDLCIVTAPPEVVLTRKAYRLAPTGPAPGDYVVAYGHPFLRPLTKSPGTYVSTSREPLDMDNETLGFDPKKVIRIGRVDFMVFPGNSGSPLLNEDDEVIGIIFAYDIGRAGLFIPLEDIREMFTRGE